MGHRAARVASTALILAGAACLVFPLALIAYTDTLVGPAQEAALAAWEEAGSSPRMAQGASPDARGASPRKAPPAVAGRPAGPSPAGGLILTIPRLRLRRFVPEGAAPEHLRRYGIGRITWTSLPEAPGVVGIAGHRTTYGAPFFRLGALGEGDRVFIDRAGRRFTYVVAGKVTVRPDQVDVLRAQSAERGVALVTCTPLFSAAYRLVVMGRLVDVAPLAGVAPPDLPPASAGETN